jgi:ribonuclease HI
VTDTVAIGRRQARLGPQRVVVHTDGGARGNPGPAAIGVVVRTDGHQAPLVEISERIGSTTNNVAEYKAAIAGLEAAAALGAREVVLRTDSQLLVEQLRGNYKVRSAHLVPLFHQTLGLLASFDKFTVEHVRREANAEADRLVNIALDAKPHAG